MRLYEPRVIQLRVHRDLLDQHQRGGLSARKEVMVSARTGEGIERLYEAIDAVLHSDPVIEAQLRVPQHEGAALATIDAGMVVHSRSYEGNLVHLSVSGLASLLGRLREFRVRRTS